MRQYHKWENIFYKLEFFFSLFLVQFCVQANYIVHFMYYEKGNQFCHSKCKDASKYSKKYFIEMFLWIHVVYIVEKPFYILQVLIQFCITCQCKKLSPSRLQERKTCFVRSDIGGYTKRLISWENDICLSY